MVGFGARIHPAQLRREWEAADVSARQRAGRNTGKLLVVAILKANDLRRRRNCTSSPPSGRPRAGPIIIRRPRRAAASAVRLKNSAPLRWSPARSPLRLSAARLELEEIGDPLPGLLGAFELGVFDRPLSASRRSRRFSSFRPLRDSASPRRHRPPRAGRMMRRSKRYGAKPRRPLSSSASLKLRKNGPSAPISPHLMAAGPCGRLRASRGIRSCIPRRVRRAHERRVQEAMLMLPEPDVANGMPW